MVVLLGSICPTICSGIRRLHDTGKSGIWMLLYFVPFGNLVLLFFLAQESEPQPNQYGPVPYLIG